MPATGWWPAYTQRENNPQTVAPPAPAAAADDGVSSEAPAGDLTAAIQQLSSTHGQHDKVAVQN